MDRMWATLTLLVLACLATAAWRDLGTRIIPDALPAALLLLGIALRARGGAVAAGLSLLVALALFALLTTVHARGWLGGGDVKLASGIAAGLAPQAVPLFLFATGLAGGVLAAAYLGLRLLPRPRYRARAAPLLPRLCRVERWRIVRRGPLPYGIAIACGGAWAMLAGAGG
jgi:prepilin peptidase CpaA